MRRLLVVKAEVTAVEHGRLRFVNLNYQILRAISLFDGEVNDYPSFDQIEIHFDDLLSEVHNEVNKVDEAKLEPKFTKNPPLHR